MGYYGQYGRGLDAFVHEWHLGDLTDDALNPNVVEACQAILDAISPEHGYRLSFVPSGTAATSFSTKRVVVTSEALRGIGIVDPGRYGTANPLNAAKWAKRALKYERGKRFGITAGMICHEVAHIRYGQDTAGAVDKAYAGSPNLSLAQTISNYLDENRIEAAFAWDFPGYGRPAFDKMLEWVATKGQMLRRKADPNHDPKIVERVTDRAGALNAILLASRYDKWYAWRSDADDPAADRCRQFGKAWVKRYTANDSVALHLAGVKACIDFLRGFPKPPEPPKPTEPPQGDGESQDGEGETEPGTSSVDFGGLDEDEDQPEQEPESQPGGSKSDESDEDESDDSPLSGAGSDDDETEDDEDDDEPGEGNGDDLDDDDDDDGDDLDDDGDDDDDDDLDEDDEDDESDDRDEDGEGDDEGEDDKSEPIDDSPAEPDDDGGSVLDQPKPKQVPNTDAASRSHGTKEDRALDRTLDEVLKNRETITADETGNMTVRLNRRPTLAGNASFPAPDLSVAHEVRLAFESTRFSHDEWAGGHQTGRFRSRDAAHAAAGDLNVFSRRENASSTRVHLALVLDHSGSMTTQTGLVMTKWGYRNWETNLLGKAKQMAETIAVAMESSPVFRQSVWRYTNRGISANSVVNVDRLWQSGDSTSIHDALVKGGNPDGSTPTGDALWAVCREVKDDQRADEALLVLSLTDGEPDNRQVVRNTTQYWAEHGVAVVGVLIDTLREQADKATTPEQQATVEAIRRTRLADLADQYGEGHVIEFVGWKELAEDVGEIVGRTLAGTMA